MLHWYLISIPFTLAGCICGFGKYPNAVMNLIPFGKPKTLRYPCHVNYFSDCWNRPITGVPTRKTQVLERETDDFNKTFKYVRIY